MAEILIARYEFEDWEWWAAELNDATQQFHERFGVYPNLMGGGPELYKKIDEIIQDDLENVVNDAEPVEVDGPVVARRYGVA